MLSEYPSKNTANKLQQLASYNDWKRGVSGHSGIPFGDWADVVVEYCTNGFTGLEDMAARNDRVTFVLGLLSVMDSLSALNTTEKILINSYDQFMRNENDGNKIIGTLNLIAMSQKTRHLKSKNIFEVREFMHRFLETSISAASAGTTFCALRFYGDSSSLPIIRGYPPMPDCWEEARKSALSIIRKKYV